MKPSTELTQKPAFETTPEIKDDRSCSKTTVIGLVALVILLTISVVIGVITFLHVKSIAEQEEAFNDVKIALERARLGEQEESISDHEMLELERMVDEDSTVDTEDDTVEANITYHLPLLDKTIEEKVVVTNDEEDITTPELRIIFDYNRSYVVTYFHTDENGTEVDICFVRKFTPHEQTSRIKAIVKTEKRDEVVMGDTTGELYTSTGETFDRNLLSKRASKMCENSQIYLTVKTQVTDLDNTEGESAVRRKRTAPCNGFTYCGGFCVKLTEEKPFRTCTRKWFRVSCKYVIKEYTVNKCFYGCHCIYPVK